MGSGSGKGSMPGTTSGSDPGSGSGSRFGSGSGMGVPGGVFMCKAEEFKLMQLGCT
jgi:hypothetical protein